MSNESRISNDITQIAIGNFGGTLTTSSPTAANNLFRGVPTEVQMNPSAVADTAARQSAKFDFGSIRGVTYQCRATFELAVVSVNKNIAIFLAPSSNGTAGNGNVGNTTGADSAYTPEPDLLAQMIYVGSLSIDNNSVIQTGVVGTYVPMLQYANLVIVNSSGQALATATTEHHIVFDAISYGT